MATDDEDDVPDNTANLVWSLKGADKDLLDYRRR